MKCTAKITDEMLIDDHDVGILPLGRKSAVSAFILRVKRIFKFEFVKFKQTNMLEANIFIKINIL